MKQETQCVHAGTVHDDHFGGLNTPIYTSSAFNYVNREEATYPRYFNTPNQKAVVEKLCALEKAEDGVLFSSGMAALSTTILAFTSPGDHVVLMDELYGGTHALATDTFHKLGLKYSFASTHAQSIEKAIQNDTKLVVVESPTNPLLSIIDIRQVAHDCRSKGVITVMDNTFATPINQNPIELGIDIVVHSGTKYLGGHSDICCGVALTTQAKTDQIRSMAKQFGGSLNANTGYLLERSLKTLAIRVERQTRNAHLLSQFLAQNANIGKVFYPGLRGNQEHIIARSQMHAFGAVLSFELNCDRVHPSRFVSKLKLIKPAVSLGGVESTICAPCVTSHVRMTPAERQRIGITDNLLRLSVGIEAAEDLIDDIRTALES